MVKYLPNFRETDQKSPTGTGGKPSTWLPPGTSLKMTRRTGIVSRTQLGQQTNFRPPDETDERA
eukprot:2196805-Pyramimonas_sp.AAC.1